MALVLTIGGINRTSVLLRNTLIVEQQAADFISTCSLTLYDADGDIAIAAEDAITVVDTATYFSGRVVDIRYSLLTASHRLIHLKCQDLNYQMGETVVDTEEVYDGVAHGGITADSRIIDNLFDTYLNTVTSDDFALNQTIQDPLPITIAPTTLRSAISQICTRTGGYFYIDFDNKFHYFSAEADGVAWWLSDDPDQVDSFSYLLKDPAMQSAATTRLDGVFVVGAGVEGWRGTHAVGDRQAIVRDNRITTTTGRDLRGDAILAKYGAARVTYTVSTYKVGLRAGMDIRFINALYGEDDTFTVRKMLVKWDVTGTVYFTLTIGAVVNPSLVGERTWTDTLDDALRPVSAPRLPTSSRGWSQDLVFSATDNDTVAWADAGVITLADGTTYTISPADDTGNMAAITYIYLDINTSTTALQKTTTAATAVGSGKLLIAVAENVADAAKKAVFQAFGGAGQGVMITADSIVASTITGNEINANSIAAGHIIAGAVETDKLNAGAVTAAKIAANTITADKIEMGIGDSLFNAADGLLLLGPHCEINPTEWWSLRKQLATLSGAFHQEAGRWMGTRGLVIEETTTNLITNPSIEVDIAGWIADGITRTRDITYSVFGTAALKVVTDNAAALEGFVRVVTGETAADTEYTFSAYLRGSGTVRLSIWDTNGGNQFGPTITLTNVWTRYTFTATFSDGVARWVQIYTNVQQDITFYCDGFQLEQQDYATSYSDGSLGTGYAWAGAAHGSTSTRTVTIVDVDAHAGLLAGNDTWSMRVVAQMPYDSDATWSVAGASMLCGWRASAEGGEGWVIYDMTDDRWKIRLNSVDVLQSSVQSFEAGDWIELILTVDYAADSYELFLQGISEDTAANVLAAQTTDQLKLGSRRDSTFQGGFNIAEFAVFDRVLTAVEVAAMYALQRPLVDAGSLDKPGIYILDGRFRIASSLTGNRIDITADEIAGYDSGGTKQFYLQSSDGAAMAGAGGVRLNAAGLVLVGSGAAGSTRMLRFRDDSGTEATMGRIYASYAGPGPAYAWIHTLRGAGDPWTSTTIILAATDDVAVPADDTRISIESGGTITIGGDLLIASGVLRLDGRELKYPAGGAAGVQTIPDAFADAWHIVDDGGVPVEYLRIVSTGAAWAFAIDPAAAGVNVGIGMVPTANGVLSMNLPTENFEVIDAGSAGATEQDWIQVEINGVTGYIRVFAAV